MERCEGVEGTPIQSQIRSIPDTKAKRFSENCSSYLPPPPPPVSIPPGGGGGVVTGWFPKNATVSYCTGLHNYES